jgi:acyl transferase domain-containing protein/acyl carrier protein
MAPAGHGSVVRTAFLFPGQGGYSRGLLPGMIRQLDGVDGVLDAVRAVARDEADVALDQYIVDENLDLGELLRAAPDALQFLIYAASVGAAQALRKAGIAPSVCVGHSLGEISALAAASACTVEDGARIIAHRIRALSTVADHDGYMLSADLDRPRATSLLSLLDANDLAIAGQNEERQVIFSGSAATMDRLGQVLHATGTTSNRLASPYPFHSPLLAPAVPAFAAALAGIRWTEPTVPVYSPILGRAYRPGDDMAALLAAHLTLSFDFLSTVRSLYADGTHLFVECGGRDVLTKIVKRVLSDESGWTAVATDSTTGAAASVEHILQLATGMDGDLRHRIRTLLNPVPSAGEFDRYWAAEGLTLMAEIQRSYERFRTAARAPRAEPATAAAQPPAAAQARPAASRPVADPVAEGFSAPAAGQAGGSGPVLDRGRVYAELVDLYGDALEYPPEVFSEEVDLEGELGVDSVKQTDLLGRVARRYGLPPAPEGLVISKYRTLGQVVDLVMGAAGQRVPVA